MKAYHIAVSGRDDTQYAKKIAHRLNLDLTITTLEETKITSLYEMLWDTLDQPLADVSLLPTLAVAEQASSNVTVVLSGEGGDELFGGYLRHRRLSGISADLNAIQKQKSLSSLFRIILDSAPLTLSLLPKMQGSRRSLEALFNNALGTYFAETAIASGVVDESSLQRKVIERISKYEKPDGILALDRLIYLPDNLLHKIDIATMAHSIEGRVPFLDKEVFNLVGGASLSWKRENNIGKMPLKRLLSREIPKELAYRGKTGFSISLSQYFFPYYRDLTLEALTWYKKSFTGLIPTFDTLLDIALKKNNYTNLEKILGHSIYAIVILYVFYTKHLK